MLFGTHLALRVLPAWLIRLIFCFGFIYLTLGYPWLYLALFWCTALVLSSCGLCSDHCGPEVWNLAWRTGAGIVWARPFSRGGNLGGSK